MRTLECSGPVSRPLGHSPLNEPLYLSGGTNKETCETGEKAMTIGTAGSAGATLHALEQRIDEYAALSGPQFPEAARQAVESLLGLLERGELRPAEKDADGNWRAVPWVKRGILLGFRLGTMIDMSPEISEGSRAAAFRFFDKDTFPLRNLSVSDGVRVVPGGSSIRRGVYVAPGVVCMPPMYINVGAYVGSGTMVACFDSF